MIFSVLCTICPVFKFINVLLMQETKVGKNVTMPCSLEKQLIEKSKQVVIIDLSTYTCRTGGSSQPIWLTSIPCKSSSSCISQCQGCPSKRVSSCRHYEDVTVSCSKFVIQKIFLFYLKVFQFVHWHYSLYHLQQRLSTSLL